MKYTKVLTAVVLLAIVSLATSSCKKEVTQVVNQVYSVTYTINPGDWKATTSGQAAFYVNLNVQEIDKQVVGNGGVVTYLSFDNGNSFDAVPEEFNGISYNAVHSNGNLYVEGHAVDGGSVTMPSSTILAKVVILDGIPLQ